MAFTEFYVTKSGDASATNGGSSTGAPIVVDDVDAVHDGAGVHTLTDQGTDGFAGVAKDDFLCWDYEGAAEFARVNSVTSDDVIVVQNMEGAVQFTALTEKKVKVKGPWDTCYAAVQTITTSFVNDDGNPPRVNIGPGTYEEEVEIISSGTVDCPLTFEGYYSTAGDECDNSGTFTPPIIAGGAGVTQDGTFFASSAADYHNIRNLKITCTTAGKSALEDDGSNCLIDRVWVSATGGEGMYLASGSNVISNCYIESASTYGIRVGNYDKIINCYIRSAGADGILIGARSAVIGCIVEGCAGDCIYCNSYSCVIDHCTLYGSTAGSGVKLAGSTGGYAVTNCIFDTMNQYGIEAAESVFIAEANNSFRSCTQGVRNANVLSDPQDCITHAVDPFTNAAGHDFSLNSAATGGTLLKSTGNPGELLDGTNIGYADIGALRHEDPAGGGGGSGGKLVGPGGGLVG